MQCTKACGCTSHRLFGNVTTNMYNYICSHDSQGAKAKSNNVAIEVSVVAVAVAIAVDNVNEPSVETIFWRHDTQHNNISNVTFSIMTLSVLLC